MCIIFTIHRVESSAWLYYRFLWIRSSWRISYINQPKNLTSSIFTALGLKTKFWPFCTACWFVVSCCVLWILCLTSCYRIELFVHIVTKNCRLCTVRLFVKCTAFSVFWWYVNYDLLETVYPVYVSECCIFVGKIHLHNHVWNIDMFIDCGGIVVWMTCCQIPFFVCVFVAICYVSFIANVAPVRQARVDLYIFVLYYRTVLNRQFS